MAFRLWTVKVDGEPLVDPETGDPMRFMTPEEGEEAVCSLFGVTDWWEVCLAGHTIGMEKPNGTTRSYRIMGPKQ